MKSFLGREVRHYYIELTNRCFLACSACARTPVRAVLKPQDLPFSIIENIILSHPLSERSDLVFILSGVFGDPIYHPQFLEIIALMKEHGAKVSIVTNGSYKEESWWHQFAQLLTGEDEITFSIDGLKGSHEIYRQFGSFEQSFKALQLMRSSRAKLIWKYIVFPHNQSLVSQAKEIAEKLGVNFVLHQTDRTNNKGEFILPGESWKPPRLKRKELAKAILKKLIPKYEGNLSELLTIEPRCASGKEPTFISSKGEVFPCCRPTADFYSDDSLDSAPFLEMAGEWSLENKTLEEIFAHPFFSDFIAKITANPAQAPYICQKNCSRATPLALELLAECE